MIDGMVSIITPCFNGAKYISETINSVLAQTYQNWEMIIVDDGSKDDSAKIVQSYTQNEPRIRLIQQKNAGSAAARNNGIRQAEGQYIALLDADDFWEPDVLHTQIAFMVEKKAVCVCSSYRRVDERSEEICRVTKAKPIITVKDMFRRNYIGCLSGLYDSKKYGKVYLREELKSIRDDYAYWLDIVKLEGKAYGNPEILASYRVLANSTTGKKTKLIKRQYCFYREYLGLNTLRSLVNTLIWGMTGILNFT